MPAARCASTLSCLHAAPKSATIEGRALAIGTTRRGGVCRVPFGAHGVHALVIGATGSGKTVTQAAVVEAYVLANLGAIVIDPKGDRDLLSIAAHRPSTCHLP